MGLVSPYNVAALLGLRSEPEPDYALIFREGDKEMRQYRGFMLARTKATGSYSSAMKRCFHRLAEYMAGDNSAGEKIAFRSPVFQQKEGNEWTLSFILPDYLDLKSAPQPMHPNITIYKVPPRKVAVIRYSSWNSPAKIKAKELELRSWLAQPNDFAPISPGRVADYGPAIVVPFHGRHEVQIDVKII